jgi:hypothetical protein
MYLGINYINKQEFLQVYLLARASVFTVSNIYRVFRSAGLILLDPAVVIKYLKVEPRQLTPNNPAPNKPIVLQTPQNILQLQHYTTVVLELLYNRSYSPRSPEQLIIEQLYKSTEIAIYTAALIAGTNKSLIATNTRLTGSKQRSDYILYLEVFLLGRKGQC